MTHDHDPELDALFHAARARARAPAGFATRVMAQVALTPRVAPAVAPAPEPAYAFWLRAAAHPAVVLAFMLCGVVALWSRFLTVTGPALVGQAGGVFLRAWANAAHGLEAAAPALRDPLVSGIVLAMVSVPLVLLARDAARVAERLTLRLAGPHG